MNREIVIAIRMALATLVLTGLVYPAVMTGLAQVLFPHEANGSLVAAGDRVLGSELIGQRFAGRAYFHNRPSAAGADGYDASISSGSNLGPTSRKLRDRVTASVDSLRAQAAPGSGLVPPDLVSASGSGLDPHVSVEGALWEAPRVAAARGLPLREVEALVQARIEPRAFSILGEPRVNVLLLNLDLDRRHGRPAGSTG